VSSLVFLTIHEIEQQKKKYSGEKKNRLIETWHKCSPFGRSSSSSEEYQSSMSKVAARKQSIVDEKEKCRVLSILTHWLRKCETRHRWPADLGALVYSFARTIFHLCPHLSRPKRKDYFRYLDDFTFEVTGGANYHEIYCDPVICVDSTGPARTVSFKMTIVDFGELSHCFHRLGLARCDSTGKPRHSNSLCIEYMAANVGKLKDACELHCSTAIAIATQTQLQFLESDTAMWKSGDSVGFKIDTNEGTIFVYRNDQCLGLGFKNIQSQTYFRPFFNTYDKGYTMRVDQCGYD